MYTTRHSGWLGPSGYIHAYPKVYPKPSLRMRLTAWRRYFSYAFFLTGVTFLVVSGVNLYASTLVAPISTMHAIEQFMTAPSPRSGNAMTLGLSTLPASSEPDSRLKEFLNKWAENHPNQKWSIVVQGLGEEKRFARLNPDLVYPSAWTFESLSTASAGAGLLVRAYHEDASVLQHLSHQPEMAVGCGVCRVDGATVESDSFRHQIAVVRHAAGAYILSVFTDGARYGQIAQLSAEIHSRMTR